MTRVCEMLYCIEVLSTFVDRHKFPTSPKVEADIGRKPFWFPSKDFIDMFPLRLSLVFLVSAPLLGAVNAEAERATKMFHIMRKEEAGRNVSTKQPHRN